MKMIDGKIMDDDIPNINLENFDEVRFIGSRYVLTSPRSLEACARLKIKPVDLLPKSKEDFAHQYKNFSVSKIDMMFSHFEASRRDKLMKARLERIRLMKFPQSNVDNLNKENQLSMLQTEQSQIFSACSASPKQQPLMSGHRASATQYSKILNKLPPRESKRIRIAQQRYMNTCPRTAPSAGAQRLVVNGMQTRPQSSAARICDSRKSNPLEAARGDNSISRSRSQCSLFKESDFWARRQAKESSHSQEIHQLKQTLYEKEKKVEQNREEQLKERQRQLLNAHVERERRLRQAQERRHELETMLEAYRKELQETREQTQQRARERALSRQILEQQRLAEERRQREIQAKENYKQVQQREEEWRKMAEQIQKQKQENIERFLDEREARIQESRNLALQAERLREEMLRVYNLDSFDKKVQKVTLINELGLGGTP